MQHSRLTGLAEHLKPYVEHGILIDAPHFNSTSWHEELLSGVPLVKLANAVDAKESAFARLAWTMRDHEGFVSRFTQRFRFRALLQCFERCGAIPFDLNAKLSSDLGPAVRFTWISGAGRYGLHAIQADERRLWRWVLSVLQASGQTIMSPDECTAFDAMPDELLLHRGFGAALDANPATLHDMAVSASWTRHRPFAEFFAGHGEALVQVDNIEAADIETIGFVASAKVAKSRVLACLDYGGGVDEFIVADPNAFEDLQIARHLPIDA